MDWTKHYEDAKGYRRWPNEELVRFMSTVPASERSVWLEAGCGGGGNLAAMAAPGRTVIGVDTHVGALNVARRAAGGAVVAAADIFNLPFGDETIDGVVDSMVSQHVSSVDHFVLYDEYRRVLKPGGWLFVYHLDLATDCKLMVHEKDEDWTGLSLFPTVPFFCLPRPEVLVDWIEVSKFKVVSLSRLKRTYDNGETASYSVVSAVAS